MRLIRHIPHRNREPPRLPSIPLSLNLKKSVFFLPGAFAGRQERDSKRISTTTKEGGWSPRQRPSVEKKRVPLMRNGTAHRRRGPKTALARVIRSCHADSFWPRSLQGPLSFEIPTGHGIEILGRVVAAKELHPDDGEDVDDSQMIVAVLYPPSSWRPTGSRCSPSNWNSFARCSCWCKCDA